MQKGLKHTTKLLIICYALFINYCFSQSSNSEYFFLDKIIEKTISETDSVYALSKDKFAEHTFLKKYHNYRFNNIPLYYSFEEDSLTQQKKIIEALNDEVLSKISNKRVKDFGVLLKKSKDQDFIIRLLSKDLFKEKGVLSKVKDSISLHVFNVKNRNTYIKQLKIDNFKLQKLDFDNKKLLVYRDNIDSIINTYKYYEVNISTPLFSYDGNNVIIFHWTSHYANVHIFVKKINKWMLYKSYNTSFSDLNY